MHRTLLIVSLLASGAAAAAHAETVPAAAPTATPVAAVAPAPQQKANRFNSPLTVEQAEALMCPRWNCDATAIDKAYRAALAKRQPAPAAAPTAVAVAQPVSASAM